MLGVKINNLTVGSELFVDYYSFQGQDTENIFRGACFSLRPTIDLYYKFNKWLELKGGIGGIWLKTNFEYQDMGWLISDQYGTSFLLNLKIFTWKYIDLEIINKMDLIFLTDSNFQITGVSPYYIGGLRTNFHPKITWFSIYFEIDGMYFNYTIENKDVKIATVLASAGISIDLSFPWEKADEKIEKEDKKINKREKIKKKKEETEVIEKKYDDPNYIMQR